MVQQMAPMKEETKKIIGEDENPVLKISDPQLMVSEDKKLNEYNQKLVDECEDFFNKWNQRIHHEQPPPQKNSTKTSDSYYVENIGEKKDINAIGTVAINVKIKLERLNSKTLDLLKCKWPRDNPEDAMVKIGEMKKGEEENEEKKCDGLGLILSVEDNVKENNQNEEENIMDSMLGGDCFFLDDLIAKDDTIPDINNNDDMCWAELNPSSFDLEGILDK